MNKQETLEEAARKWYSNTKLFDKGELNAFIAGAKWQQERMYSEEDLKSAFFNGGDMKDIEEFNYWLEQFKRK
jgi:DNA-binding transcriptional regulator WhiA